MPMMFGRVITPPSTIPQGNDNHYVEKHVAVDAQGFLQVSPESSGYNLSEQVVKSANYVWNTDLLAWVRSTGDGAPVGGSDANTAKRYDIGTSFIYVGEAAPGVAESSAGWRIKRVTLVSGTPTDTKYAAAGAMTAVWNNRASETYT